MSSTFAPVFDNTTNITCVSTLEVAVETLGYNTSRFHNTEPIIKGHFNPPRFGRTNNISTVIFNATSENTEQYLIGVSATSIILFIAFSFWVCVLIILKLLGRNVVGFFSGSDIQLPSPPKSPDGQTRLRLTSSGSNLVDPATNEDDDNEFVDAEEDPKEKTEGSTRFFDTRQEAEDYDGIEAQIDVETQLSASEVQDLQTLGDTSETQEKYENSVCEWKEKVQAKQIRMRRIRITVIICGLLTILCEILLIAVGIPGLILAVNSARNGLTQAEDLCNEAVDLIDNFLASQNTTLAIATSAFESQSSAYICPEVVDLACQATTIPNCTQTLTDVGAALELYLGTGFAVVSAELLTARSDFLYMATVFSDLNQRIGSYMWAFYVSQACVALLLILTMIIVSGVVVAWKKMLRGSCLEKCATGMRLWIAVPLFIFLLFVGWIFSLAFLISWIVTADFCYDSPDPYVLGVLEENKDKFSSFLYNLTIFYINGCPDPKTTYDTALSFLQVFIESMNLIVALTEVVSSNTVLITETCGTSPSALDQAVLAVQSQVCTLSNLATDTVDYFSCANWNPLYEVVAYQSACYNLSRALTWISYTQIVTVFFSMIMLTLRVGFSELKEGEATKRRCCGCRREPADPENDGQEIEPDDVAAAADNKMESYVSTD